MIDTNFDPHDSFLDYCETTKLIIIAVIPKTSYYNCLIFTTLWLIFYWKLISIYVFIHMNRLLIFALADVHNFISNIVYFLWIVGIAHPLRCTYNFEQDFSFFYILFLQFFFCNLVTADITSCISNYYFTHLFNKQGLHRAILLI